jgi:putative SOS response-associated peptidase YedK
VIRQNPKEPIRELSLMKWGLIPSWSWDASGAARMINARSETASTKLAFSDALKSRRCLISADGFYEWKREGKTKQPFCFEVNEGELFAFAGLWDCWKDPRKLDQNLLDFDNDPECRGRHCPRPDARDP